MVGACSLILLWMESQEVPFGRMKPPVPSPGVRVQEPQQRGRGETGHWIIPKSANFLHLLQGEPERGAQGEVT